MSPNVSFDFPEQKLLPPLPWSGRDLHTIVQDTARAADPYGRFERRSAAAGDYVLNLSRHSAENVVHGSGWGAYTGQEPSPLSRSPFPNPVGPALASAIACARLFGSMDGSLGGPFILDAYNYTGTVPTSDFWPGVLEPGTIWSIGTGSVGTAAMYFLSLATQSFDWGGFDMDEVKVENLDRSPIFSVADAVEHRRKVDVTANFLRQAGVRVAFAEDHSLDEAEHWLGRQNGTPDLLVSAANEREVRYVTEAYAPPLQIYATTGENENVTAFRHIPLIEPCSCCAFPPEKPKDTDCASGSVTLAGKQVDAALPYLSFAAGVMICGEIIRAQAANYPTSANRVALYLSEKGPPTFIPVNLVRRNGCVCEQRSPAVHAAMIKGTRYARASYRDAVDEKSKAIS
jgi:hypothetical protein